MANNTTTAQPPKRILNLDGFTGFNKEKPLRINVIPHLWRIFADKILGLNKATTVLVLPTLKVPDSHRYGAMAPVELAIVCSHNVTVNVAETRINTDANNVRGTHHSYEYIISLCIEGQRAVPTKALKTVSLVDETELRHIVLSSFGAGIDPQVAQPSVHVPPPRAPRSATEIAKQLDDLEKEETKQ